MPKYWLPWLVGMPAEQSRAACCLIFGGVLERLPKLRVCFAHGGGAFPYTIGRIEHGFRMRPDLVATDNARNPREYFDRIYFDSCVHDDARAALSARCRRRRHVMLGTDYPFPARRAGTRQRHRRARPRRRRAASACTTAPRWNGSACRCRTFRYPNATAHWSSCMTHRAALRTFAITLAASHPAAVRCRRRRPRDVQHALDGSDASNSSAPADWPVIMRRPKAIRSSSSSRCQDPADHRQRRHRASVTVEARLLDDVGDLPAAWSTRDRQGQADARLRTACRRRAMPTAHALLRA